MRRQLVDIFGDVDAALTRRPAGGLDRFAQQRCVLAGKVAPGAERVEAVAEAVFVDQRRECANLFETIGRRHLDVGVGA
jgi:hypothetical protein